MTRHKTVGGGLSCGVGDSQWSNAEENEEAKPGTNGKEKNVECTNDDGKKVATERECPEGFRAEKNDISQSNGSVETSR